MKKLENMKKKELIEYITTIRPKADAYNRVCEQLGIDNNILGFVKKLTIPDVVNQRELLLKEISNWLMTSTTLSVEAIVEMEAKFKQ